MHESMNIKKNKE